MMFDKYKNMEELFEDLKKQDKVKNLLKEKGLNISLARVIIRVWESKPSEVAQKLGIHKSTIERYVNVLGKFTESEFELIRNSEGQGN